MKALPFLALAAAMYISPASSCSIDELKKVAAEHLEILPSDEKHSFVRPDWSTEGGSWQMFEGGNGTPHSIVVTFMGETGRTKVRISFLNRGDFVISATSIEYAEWITDPNRTGKFKIEPTKHYFFCDSTPLIPPGTENPSEVLKEANRWKTLFFEEADMLKAEIQRVPE